MFAHRPRHAHRRQLNDPLSVPTVSGIANTALTAAGTAATGAPLALDTSADRGAATTGNVEFNSEAASTVSVVATSTSSKSSATPTPTESVASPSSSSNDISIGAVVAACIGAFVGAVIIIFAAVWYYRRYTDAARRRGMASRRNARGEHERSRSRLENWAKLGEGEDKWEGMHQTKEVEPMEKLTMFKKTPSLRTAYTHKSEELPPFNLEPHPFATYHPNLARELAGADVEPEPQVPPAAFIPKLETGPTMSWGETNSSNTSFLSLDKAIPTPSVTSSAPHAWQSAEVLHFDEHAADSTQEKGKDIQNPFLAQVERRKSGGNNPFFNAQSSSAHSLRKSYTSPPSSSVYHSPISDMPTVTPPSPTTPTKADKGKARDLTGSSADPFADPNELAPPSKAGHVSEVTSMASSNDRAIQSLIAALDGVPPHMHDKLRVASLQPSVMSETSVYTTVSAYEDVTGSFPLPPNMDMGSGGVIKP